jgi:hypothetical protein
MTQLADRARIIGGSMRHVAGNTAFRWRLLRMALRPMSSIPAAVVLALDAPDYDYADDPGAVR